MLVMMARCGSAMVEFERGPC